MGEKVKGTMQGEIGVKGKREYWMSKDESRRVYRMNDSKSVAQKA